MENEAGPQNKYFKSILQREQDSPGQQEVFQNTLRLNNEIKALRKEIDQVNGQIIDAEKTQQQTANNYVV